MSYDLIVILFKIKNVHLSLYLATIIIYYYLLIKKR